MRALTLTLTLTLAWRCSPCLTPESADPAPDPNPNPNPNPYPNPYPNPNPNPNPNLNANLTLALTQRELNLTLIPFYWEELVVTAVSTDGCALQHAPTELRADYDVVKVRTRARHMPPPLLSCQPSYAPSQGMFLSVD